MMTDYAPTQQIISKIRHDIAFIFKEMRIRLENLPHFRVTYFLLSIKRHCPEKIQQLPMMLRRRFLSR